MIIVLSHHTAYQFWMSPYVRSEYTPTNPQATTNFTAPFDLSGGTLNPPLASLPRKKLQSVAHGFAKAAALLTASDIGFISPFHFLIFNKNHMNSTDAIRMHYQAKRPPHLRFYECNAPLLEGFYVVSPELTFLQMALSLNAPLLAMAGSELCSQFCYLKDGTLRARTPVTEKRIVQSFVRRSTGLRGRKQAEHAACHIINGAASPPEIRMALNLTLPQRLGGKGLPKPTLNAKIEVPATLQSHIDWTYFVCDLYWPYAHLALEYDSDEVHATSAKIAQDAQRREQLALIGIDTITVTNAQLRTAAGIDRLALICANKLGIRIRSRYRTSEHRIMEHQLWRELRTPRSKWLQS